MRRLPHLAAAALVLSAAAAPMPPLHTRPARPQRLRSPAEDLLGEDVRQMKGSTADLVDEPRSKRARRRRKA